MKLTTVQHIETPSGVVTIVHVYDTAENINRTTITPAGEGIEAVVEDLERLGEFFAQPLPVQNVLRELTNFLEQS